MPHRITYQDIARKAGVSNCLVSRALTGKTGVSEKKRALILRTADQLGYQKNPAAKLLAGQRHGKRERPLIALIRQNERWDNLFRETCENSGADALTVGPEDAASPALLCDSLFARGVDGIVLNPHQIPMQEPAWQPG